MSATRRTLLRAASLGIASLGTTSRAAPAQTAGTPSPSDQLNQAGPEARHLATRVGLWDVTETIWPSPAAAPIDGTGLVAERVLLGTLLQELIRPLADAAHADVKRTDLLCYNRLDGRWDYVSFDTRAPVGLMPAYSTGRGTPDRIELAFLPFAIVGFGDGGTGQMVRMRQQIVAHGPDRESKDQYFTLADGTGTEWLAHRYAYVRRA